MQSPQQHNMNTHFDKVIGKTRENIFVQKLSAIFFTFNLNNESHYTAVLRIIAFGAISTKGKWSELCVFLNSRRGNGGWHALAYLPLCWARYLRDLQIPKNFQNSFLLCSTASLTMPMHMVGKSGFQNVAEETGFKKWIGKSMRCCDVSTHLLGWNFPPMCQKSEGFQSSSYASAQEDKQ